MEFQRAKPIDELRELAALENKRRVVPVKFSLVSPFSAWVSFNVLMVVVFVLSGFSIFVVARNDHEKLVNRLLRSSVKFNLSELQRGQYRGFIEGIGSDFAESFVKINSPEKEFVFGTRKDPEHCSMENITAGSSQPMSIELCLPYKSPLPVFALVVVLYLLTSLASLNLFLRLEKRAFTSLLSFVTSSGIKLPRISNLGALLDRFKEISATLSESQAKEVELAKLRVKSLIARQVAHDIRSPLTSLTLMGSEIPNNQAQQLYREAVKRISSIADDLSQKGAESYSSEEGLTLSEIVLSIVEEKRLELEIEHKIEIRAHVKKTFSSLLSFKNSQTLKRVLSNIINNATEAIEGTGRITVTLAEIENTPVIEVSDTGKGFPADILKDAGTVGLTKGKEKGSGLGLSHALATMRSWGGTVLVESKPGNTRVLLRFSSIGNLIS